MATEPVTQALLAMTSAPGAASASVTMISAPVTMTAPKEYRAS
jgi:hypothetical protein